MARLVELEGQLTSCDSKISETKAEIETVGTVFVRAKEVTEVIEDFEEMLYGDGEEPGFASEIAALATERVSIVKDLTECLAGIFSEKVTQVEKQ